jgi:hypothetical protein
MYGFFWPDSRPLFRELWQLNLATKCWNKIQMQGDIPEQLASNAAILHPAFRGVMIVYGGTGSPFGVTTSNNVVACNLESGNFHRIQTVPEDGQPMSLYGQAVVVDDKGRLYTVGGTSGVNYFINVYSLDLTSKPPAWEKLYIHQILPTVHQPDTGIGTRSATTRIVSSCWVAAPHSPCSALRTFPPFT